MPFALNDTISKSPIEGGIEITDQQYADARAAKLAGREALVIAGELVIRDPAPSPQHAWEGGEWVVPEEPEPVPYYPSTSYVVAAAYNVGIENGIVTGIGAGAKISAGFALDTGLFMLFFDEDQPDTEYFARAWDNDARLKCVSKDEYSIVIAATDAGGDPIDPETFCVEIIRVL